MFMNIHDDKSMLIICSFCKHIDLAFMKIHNYSFPMKIFEFPSICMNVLKYSSFVHELHFMNIFMNNVHEPSS